MCSHTARGIITASASASACPRASTSGGRRRWASAFCCTTWQLALEKRGKRGQTVAIPMCSALLRVLRVTTHVASLVCMHLGLLHVRAPWQRLCARILLAGHVGFVVCCGAGGAQRGMRFAFSVLSNVLAICQHCWNYHKHATLPRRQIRWPCCQNMWACGACAILLALLLPVALLQGRGARVWTGKTSQANRFVMTRAQLRAPNLTRP